MKYIFEALIVFGIVALIVTIIKYPKDVGRGLLGILLMPFELLWDTIRFFLLPVELLILYIEKKFGLNYLTRFVDHDSYLTETENLKQIKFENFRKYIIINSTSNEIQLQLQEADESFPEVNLQQNSLLKTKEYSVIEIPNASFYAYNFLIQWLTEENRKNQIVGLASSRQTKFLTISNIAGDNEMIGITNRGEKFWVSMYDDFDKKQFLRLNEKIELNTELTTEDFITIVKNADLSYKKL